MPREMKHTEPRPLENRSPAEDAFYRIGDPGSVKPGRGGKRRKADLNTREKPPLLIQTGWRATPFTF